MADDTLRPVRITRFLYIYACVQAPTDWRSVNCFSHLLQQVIKKDFSFSTAIIRFSKILDVDRVCRDAWISQLRVSFKFNARKFHAVLEFYSTCVSFTTRDIWLSIFSCIANVTVWMKTSSDMHAVSRKRQDKKSLSSRTLSKQLSKALYLPGIVWRSSMFFVS